MVSQSYINEIAYKVIGCAIEVHKELGPGLLECIYEECLIEELRNMGLSVKSQVRVPISYKGRQLKKKLKIDIIVEDVILVEDKAVETMIRLYEAQLLSYLKLSNITKGLLINFNCLNIKDQLKSLVTKEFFKLPI